mmetsp:Transcript_40472/g.101239  ORF Transcript_40472/g.101239 Transcript_40472/m.101239 type:complete len:216 (+) Transcript_40472:295-942(+)
MATLRDGVLTLQEFQAFVKLMDKTVKAKAVKTMYRAMLTESEGMGDRDSIHPYVFARTAMKHDLTSIELKHTYQTLTQQKVATLQRRDSQGDSLKRMEREKHDKHEKPARRGSLGKNFSAAGSSSVPRVPLAAPPDASGKHSSGSSAASLGSDQYFGGRRASIESLESVREGRRMSVESLEGFSVASSGSWEDSQTCEEDGANSKPAAEQQGLQC